MKPKYEIRRGFRAPTPFDDSSPDTATYEVWRRRSIFSAGYCLDVFNKESSAQKVCDILNGKRS